jgi:chromosome segregation ATPase
MKKTKQQLEEELHEANQRIRDLKEEAYKKNSQVQNLESVKSQMERNMQERENGMRRVEDFKYTIMKIIAGPSKPVSKVEAIEDLMPIDVHFMRAELEERKRYGPSRRYPIF